MFEIVAFILVISGLSVSVAVLRRRELILYGRIDQLERSDPVTGVLLRSHFVDEVTGAVANGGTGALLIVSAVRFDLANAWLGHERADVALRALVDELQQQVGPNGTIGRIAGVEFGVFLPHAGFQAAQEIAQDMVAAVAAMDLQLGGLDARLAVNVGGVAFAHPAPFWDIYRTAIANKNPSATKPNVEALYSA